MNNTCEFLNQFCSRIRDEFSEPMAYDTYVYATDGRVLVRVPQTLDDRFKAMPEETGLSMAKFFTPPFKSEEQFPLPPLPEGEKCYLCHGTGKIHKDKCQDCDGDGEFRHGRHYYECQECDGDGVIVYPNHGKVCDECHGSGTKDVAVDVGCACYGSNYLKLISDLPELAFVPAPDLKPARFIFDGGEGILMPRRK